jgi:MFS family permease
VAGARSVLRATLRNPVLRRVELAFAGFNAAEYGVWVAMLVYAYEQGGATTAGVVAVAQLLPAVGVAPVAAGMADRNPGRVLALGYAVQAAAMAATAILLAVDAPPGTAYGGAIVAASAVTLTRPAQAALLPTLVDGPEQLTAANAVSGWVESSCVLIGPALAGVLLGLGGPEAAFAVFAAGVAVSTALVAGLGKVSDAVPSETVQGLRRQVTAGLRALGTVPGSGSLVAILATQFAVIGALDVLTVVLALDVLDLGSSAAGYLTAAFGAGGAVGAVLALGLVGRRTLVPAIVGAAAAWGVAFALVGVWELALPAFLLIAAGGSARSLLDVAGRTLLQRAAPPEALARVFGVLEGLLMLGLAVGSLSVPILIRAAGPGTAFAVAGLSLPALVLARLGALRRIDADVHAPVTELAALRTSRIFSTLPGPELEGLARSLRRSEWSSGEVVVREGDPGDRFYLIVEGELEVAAGGATLNTLGPGDGFGEIALLHDVPRTATVTARTRVTLWELERAPFLAAVTRHVSAREAATSLSQERLVRGAIR